MNKERREAVIVKAHFLHIKARPFESFESLEKRCDREYKEFEEWKEKKNDGKGK